MEKLRKYAYISIVSAAVAAAFCLAFKYILPTLVPFLFALLLSLGVRRLAHTVSNRTRMPYKASAVVCLAVTLTVVCLALSVVFSLAVDKVGEVAHFIEEDLSSDDGMLRRAVTAVESLGERFPKLADKLTNGGEAVYSVVTEAVGKLVGKVSEAVTSFAGRTVMAMPTVLFGVISFVLASFYLTVGDGLPEGWLTVLPEKVRRRLDETKASISKAVSGYARAYLVILAVNFAVLSIGFVIIRVKYPFAVAVLIAVADLLPVIGVGTVIVPWCIICLLGGNTARAVGLLVIFAVTEAVRQIAEPHLVGGFIGIEPLASIAAAYAGFRLFGIGGMIIAPMAVYVAKEATESRAVRTHGE